MRWVILIDNITSDEHLQTEHGLSIYLETEHRKWLLDTGRTDAFIRNAELLGIDLKEIDSVFISHGHNDHVGGLAAFMQYNSRAKVYLSPYCMDRLFFSERNGLHSITADWTSVDRARLHLITQPTQIDDHTWIIVPGLRTYPLPQGNRYLLSGLRDDALSPDDFQHELAFYADGLLFTGCAHSGVENILASANQAAEQWQLPFMLHTVLGGFHLLDGLESEEELSRLASHLCSAYPSTCFHTGHCTGAACIRSLSSILGNRLSAFECGSVGII